MTEDAIIGKLRRYSSHIGDDCAIIGGRLYTTDLTIEGVHFTRETPAAAVGHKALARGLSDIAAMGGRPELFLISLALAPWTDKRWIGGFYRGLMKLAKATKTELAGGDLSHANQLVCDVMVCGSAVKGKALRRDGAKPGDLIYVSGPLGGWEHKAQILPRLEEGRKLAGKASAAMDITDGLALDLHRLLLASGAAAELDSVPLLKGATTEQALHSGEDYELLYTASPRTRVAGLKIGRITAGRPGTITMAGHPVAPRGYDHLSRMATSPGIG